MVSPSIVSCRDTQSGENWCNNIFNSSYFACKPWQFHCTRVENLLSFLTLKGGISGQFLAALVNFLCGRVDLG